MFRLCMSEKEQIIQHPLYRMHLKNCTDGHCLAICAAKTPLQLPSIGIMLRLPRWISVVLMFAYLFTTMNLLHDLQADRLFRADAMLCIIRQLTILIFILTGTGFSNTGFHQVALFPITAPASNGFIIFSILTTTIPCLLISVYQYENYNNLQNYQLYNNHKEMHDECVCHR